MAKQVFFLVTDALKTRLAKQQCHEYVWESKSGRDRNGRTAWGLAILEDIDEVMEEMSMSWNFHNNPEVKKALENKTKVVEIQRKVEQLKKQFQNNCIIASTEMAEMQSFRRPTSQKFINETFTHEGELSMLNSKSLSEYSGIVALSTKLSISTIYDNCK